MVAGSVQPRYRPTAPQNAGGGKIGHAGTFVRGNRASRNGVGSTTGRSPATRSASTSPYTLTLIDGADGSNPKVSKNPKLANP